MRPKLSLVAALLAALAASAMQAGSALAAPGFATGAVNLRAGPGTSYPQVVVVPAGAPVEILGCLPGFTWCDVGFGEVRGWVSARYLQYLHEDRRVPLVDDAPRAGVPVVGFAFGDYWGSHYRDRAWYAERDRWGGPPPRAAYRETPPPGWRPGPPGPGWRPEGPGEGRGDWRRERVEERRDERRDRRDGRREERGDWRREREERRPEAWQERRGERREERGRGRPD